MNEKRRKYLIDTGDEVILVDTGLPAGTPEEMAELEASYKHLCEMRDEIVDLGIVPPVKDWKTVNPNL